MMTKKEDSMKCYIVCGGATGRAVVIGYSATEPVVGETARLERARMLLYWPSECNGLFGFAADGPKPGTRLTPTVAVTECTCREWLAVSDEAAALVSSWG